MVLYKMSTLMEIQSVPSKDYASLGLQKERLVWMLKKMVEIRLFEEKVEELYLMHGLITGPAHLYFGEEAVAVGVISAFEVDFGAKSVSTSHWKNIINNESSSIVRRQTT